MNWIKNFKKYILLGLALLILLPVGISVAQVQNSSNPCKEIWHTKSPKGVTYDECKNGLHYPTFNAYRDSAFLGENQLTPEFEFAWIRDFEADTSVYNSQNRKGFKESITLNQPDDLGETYFYLHNAGDPNCNTSGNNNSCGKSTIAKNVQLSISSFELENGKYISKGIVSGNRRVHTINATISSSNTTPSNLSDAITVYTNKDQYLELDIDNEITFCQPNSQRDIECNANRLVYNTLSNGDLNDLFGNGLTINSSFRGSSTNGFYASEGYRAFVQLYFFPTDAPDDDDGGGGGNDPVCRDLIFERTSGSATSTTQEYEVRFTPNSTRFHDNLIIEANRANVTSDFNDPFFGRKRTDLTITNLTANSTVNLSVRGSGQDCTAQITFTDIPEGGACRDLEIIKISETEDSLTFEIDASPSSYEAVANVTASNGTLTSLGNGRYRLTNITDTTNIRASIPSNLEGSQNCNDELEFTPQQENLVCESITLNTDTYNYKQNARPTFTVTDKQPTEFNANFIWTVVNQNNQIIQTQQGENLLDFRPNSPLTGNEIVRVQVENSDNPNCRAQADSELPPIEEVCEDLELIRILNPQLRRTIPNNGQPAIFQLDAGSYEGKITFKAEGQPELTTFLTNNERTTGEITVDSDETVIILNTGQRNTIRVYAQEQNQYTIDCFLTLVADSDDEGDKLTDLEKTVNKQFATDGDVLQYTIKYTISPIFGNSNFREALEGFDTAILKDNIELIYGIQDTLNNPLEATDTSLEVMEVFIPSSLEATGDLFGPEGLVIEDLTEKAGRTYTITYTARLEADIITECQTISNSCGFEFPNTASDNFGNSDTASVLATCPFVISRSFGDVFLEEEFEGTIDISRCTNKRSSEGPVFTPKPRDPQEIINSGTGILSAPSHRICQQSISDNPILGEGLEGYDNPLQNFSSGVCEVSLYTSSNWTSEDIERNLRSNASRYSNVRNLERVPVLNNLNQEALTIYDNKSPNSKTKIYRKDDGDLEITAESMISLNDGVAKTIIVEGHDLIINQNLSYGRNLSVFPTQIAFIVIGGDIIVGSEVTELVGTMAAVPDANNEGGFIRRSSQTNKLLTIKGSIFGDSGPLFAGTSNPGDLQADKGAVTVIYDSNIILNTPPGLQSIVQFNQYQTIR